MTVPVRYHCPRCGAIATIERAERLADRSVTPTKAEGWEYASPFEDVEAADGIEIVCGASETDGEGCGRPYYVNFVRFVEGVEQDPGVGPCPIGRFDFNR